MRAATDTIDVPAWARGVLDALNAEQRRAAEATTGPVCILAGAGTGKTRTITHRIAWQVATGVARADEILAVTFTDRAAGQLRQRVAGLGLPSPVRAATFHSAAWAQVRYFWPSLSDRPLPEVLSSKVRLLLPIARRLKVQASDLAAEIEWAKARRIEPDDYATAANGRDAPLPLADMAATYADYEREKATRDLIDFDDMLALATRAVTQHPEIATTVRERYHCFTVDEFQDVNPAQQALLTAWLGGRTELCVVGDDDQTIYTFTGATHDYLTGFAQVYRRAQVVTLVQNYRSTPEVLALANRVLWTKSPQSRKRLVSTRPQGPAPRIREFTDADAERRAVVAELRRLVADGTPPGEIAICYRINAQSQDLEEALADAGIRYVVRGDGGFFARREVRQALAALQTAAGSPAPAPDGTRGTTPARPPRAERIAERVLRDRLRFSRRTPPQGQAARERWQNLDALLALVERLVTDNPALTLSDVVNDLAGRAAAEQDSPDDGGAVTLLTLHRAKGLEFDAVLLVALEEGLLPISYAVTTEEVEEERRLLYVGVTRARRHLWLSWARQRPGRSGRMVTRRPSRLLHGLGPGAPGSKRDGSRSPRPAGQVKDVPLTPEEARVGQRLRAWRLQRSTADRVPAFVVFADTTLDALARRQPSTLEQLRRIPGLGPIKVERYGEEILSVFATARGSGT